MGYALLKLVHLGSAIVWIGGMFFALFCLRPAAMGLEPAVRVPFMATALGRFFAVVLWVGLAALASGVAMVVRVGQATRTTGAPFNMPADWMAMAVLGVLMLAVFGHIRFALYKRLQRAVAAQDWPAGGAALADIRFWVGVNLAFGALIVVVTVLGAAT
ncbi:MAG TPA: CopD family protein [Burkholderiaceae bacterium]|nr:CopD family protein [Burkholderiaceae bacterium]